MPNPLVIKDRKLGGLLLDIRRVVEGTEGWEGQDEFEFCMGKATPLGENERTFRVRVSKVDAWGLVMFLSDDGEDMDDRCPTCRAVSGEPHEGGCPEAPEET